jgi:hypothetical protein
LIKRLVVYLVGAAVMAVVELAALVVAAHRLTPECPVTLMLVVLVGLGCGNYLNFIDSTVLR